MPHGHVVPWKVLVTVPSLVVVAVVAFLVGQDLVAATAVGALAGYLGRVNGSKPSD